MTTPLSSGPSAGSRRFWITVSCFFLANVAAWVGYHRWAESRLPRRDILAVNHFSPGEDAVLTDPQPTLAWTFNLDAGRPGPVTIGPGQTAPGNIQPAVKGQWSWLDARTLTFEPSERLARATRYTVKLNGVASADGYTLPAAAEEHFSTPPLNLVNVRQVAFDGEQRVLLELEFSDKVIPGEVLRHLEITSGGKTVHATLQGEGAGTIVRVLTDAVDFSGRTNAAGPTVPAAPGGSRAENAATLQVTLTPGLAGMSGPLGLEDAVTREVSVAQVILADSLEGVAGEDHGSLVLRFNNPLSADAVEALKPLLQVDPEVAFTAAMRYSQQEMQFTGPFVAGTRYTVRIARAEGGDPRKLPQPTVLSAVIPDLSPMVTFADSAGFLGSRGNRTILVRAVNMPAFRIRADRVYENNIVVWRNAHSDEDGISSAADYARPLASRRYASTGPKNQTQEIRVNLDELLGPGNAIDGTYRLEIAADDTQPAADGPGDERFWRHVYRWGNNTTLVSLSDIGLTAKLMASPSHQGTEKALLVWALGLSTSQPQADVRLRVYSSKNQLLGEGVTDAQGVAQIDHLNPAPGEEPTIVIASRGADASGNAAMTWLDLSSMQRNDSGLATNGRAYLRSGYEAFVWSERGVYRPGENVVLRAIVRGPGVTTPADKMPIRWQIRRPDGRDWIAQAAQLDEDGAAEWRLTIPADVATGYYGVQLGLPGDPAAGSAGMTTFGTTDFQVEEFIPNRIKTALTLGGKPQRFAIGEKPLTAEVQADYLFGQPAAHLQSTLSVRMSDAAFTSEAFPAAQGWQAGDTANVSSTFIAGRVTSVKLEPATLELDAAGHGVFDVDLQARVVRPAVASAGGRAAAAPQATVNYIVQSGDTLESIAHKLAPERPEAVVAQIVALNGLTESPVLKIGRILKVPVVQAAAAPDAPPAPPPAPASPAPVTPAVPAVTAIAAPAPAGEDDTSADLYSFHGPWLVSLSDETAEIGGRAVTATQMIPADALPYYIMARQTGEHGAQVGQSVAFDVRLVTPAGVAIAPGRPIEARIFQENWNNSYQRVDGRYQYQSTRVLEPIKDMKSAVAFADAAGTFSWKPAAPGSYVVQFDDGKQITTLAFYVSDAPNAGGEFGWADTMSRTHPELLDIQLVAADGGGGAAGGDKTHPLYHEGQSVKARIRSPFAGRLLLTVETDTVLLHKVVEMTENTAEVPLELPAGLWPNGYLSAQVVRAVDTNKEWRTHRAFGAVRFDIDSADEGLAIALAAPAEMRPGRTLDVALTVTDARGKAVPNAAVALAAVDEGILRLTGYQTPKPLNYFAATRALGVETADVYAQLMPEVQKLDGASAIGGDADGDAPGFVHRHSSPVSGKRVQPVALVSAIVHTDATGKAAAHLQVPEFLGQLRMMAVGYAGAGGRGLGSGEATVLVRSPLVVESSFPRFLAPGDRCQVPLLVINNSPSAGEATLRLTVDSGAVLAVDVPQRAVMLAANEQKIISFELTAQQAEGVGQIALEASLGDERYTEHLEMPVRPASPTITVGDSLIATADKPLTIKAPPAMLKGTETYELHINQRPALNLPAGLEYLDRYPYGCLEQTTSASFPLVYLPDIGAQIAPGVFAEDRVSRKVQTGILRLVGMQTATGGLSMWPGQTEDWQWGTVYAAHFLAEAAHAGYKAPADFQARLDAYLHALMSKSTTSSEIAEVQAYAAYVLALEGKPDRPMMNRLGEFMTQEQARKDGPAGMEQVQLHLALAWAASGRKDLAEKLLPQQLPVPRATRQLDGNLGSPARDQALLIMTLLTVAPDHPALPGLVEKLAAAGGDRGWLATQDNAFAVLALGKYLRTVKDDKPFDRAELLQGDTVLAQAAGNKPLAWSPAAGAARDNLSIRVTGPAGAKAYVSWLETGVPIEMPADADHALKIRRQYLHDDGTPVAASERIPTGTSLRVAIAVESASALSNVVLEDLLPAGLEAENPRLANTKHDDAAPGEARPLYWSRLDVRDDRVISVGSIPVGTSTWTYLVRAVTPGTYIVPPIRGECMYDPGINSLSGGGAKLTVVPLEKKEVAMP